MGEIRSETDLGLFLGMQYLNKAMCFTILFFPS